MHEHGWPPGLRDRHGWHLGRIRSGGLRAVRHVWVIELENQGYAQSFGTPSADPYLATALPRMGALLENYYAIGGGFVFAWW